MNLGVAYAKLAQFDETARASAQRRPAWAILPMTRRHLYPSRRSLCN